MKVSLFLILCVVCFIIALKTDTIVAYISIGSPTISGINSFLFNKIILLYLVPNCIVYARSDHVRIPIVIYAKVGS